MTERENACKALGFLNGFSPFVWHELDDRVAEAYDKALKELEAYIENSVAFTTKIQPVGTTVVPLAGAGTIDCQG